MTDDDLAALIAKAEAATPGPWFACPTVDGIAANENCRVRTETYGHGYVADTSNFHGRPFDVKRRRENAAFIAAANPSVIIPLATELQAARKALAAVEALRVTMDDEANTAFDVAHRANSVIDNVIGQVLSRYEENLRAALALANPEAPR